MTQTVELSPYFERAEMSREGFPARPSVAVTCRRRLVARVRRGACTPPFGPCEDVIAMVDDAATMAPEGRTFVLPAQIVECAPVDAQELGGFVDRKERIVDVIGHEKLPNGRSGS